MSSRQAAVPPLQIPSTPLFTTLDLVGPDGDRGAIRRAVSHRDIVKVCHGVYARSLPEDPVERHLQLVRAGLLRARGVGVVGGLSAAIVHGLDVGWWPLPQSATYVRPGSGGSSTSGIVVSSTRLPDHHVVEVGGLPVCSVARTIVDIARHSAPWHDDFIAAVVTDSALRHSPDPAALRAECEQVMDDLKGCTGMGPARRVLRAATHGSAGAAETVSRVLLERMGMPTPLLDVQFTNDTPGVDGWETVRIPFRWPSLGLLGVVLVDSGGVPLGWSGDRHSWQAGPRRWLREQGNRVVEWTVEELGRPWVVSTRLSSVIRETRGEVRLHAVDGPDVLASRWVDPEPIWAGRRDPWDSAVPDEMVDWLEGV